MLSISTVLKNANQKTVDEIMIILENYRIWSIYFDKGALTKKRENKEVMKQVISAVADKVSIDSIKLVKKTTRIGCYNWFYIQSLLAEKKGYRIIF